MLLLFTLLSVLVVSKEYDEEECCNVEIKQEIVEDPLDINKEDKYSSFDENTCGNVSIKIELEENLSTRDVSEECVKNSGKETLDKNNKKR